MNNFSRDFISVLSVHTNRNYCSFGPRIMMWKLSAMSEIAFGSHDKSFITTIDLQIGIVWMRAPVRTAENRRQFGVCTWCKPGWISRLFWRASQRPRTSQEQRLPRRSCVRTRYKRYVFFFNMKLLTVSLSLLVIISDGNYVKNVMSAVSMSNEQFSFE